MRPPKSFTDVRTTPVFKILLLEDHFLTSSLDGSTCTRHHVVPVVRHPILREGTSSENGDDSPLIIQYCVWGSIKQTTRLMYGICRVTLDIPPIPFKYLEPSCNKHLQRPNLPVQGIFDTLFTRITRTDNGEVRKGFYTGGDWQGRPAAFRALGRSFSRGFIGLPPPPLLPLRSFGGLCRPLLLVQLHLVFHTRFRHWSFALFLAAGAWG